MDGHKMQYTVDIIGEPDENGLYPLYITLHGGGGSSPFWRKMLADVYGCPISTIESKEGPALGVAILAMVAAGIYGSVQEACDAVIRKDKTAEPDDGAHRAYMKYYGLYRELYPALKEKYRELAALD